MTGKLWYRFRMFLALRRRLIMLLALVLLASGIAVQTMIPIAAAHTAYMSSDDCTDCECGAYCHFAPSSCLARAGCSTVPVFAVADQVLPRLPEHAKFSAASKPDVNGRKIKPDPHPPKRLS